MTYSSNADLPDGIKNNLPKQAQQIYIKVFNEKLKMNFDQEDDEPAESRAHKLAWSEVKKYYTRGENNWYRGDR